MALMPEYCKPMVIEGRLQIRGNNVGNSAHEANRPERFSVSCVT